MKITKKQSVFKQHMLMYIIFCWSVILLFMSILYFNMKDQGSERWKIQQENNLGSLEYLIDFQIQRMEDIVREVKASEEVKYLQLENQIVEVMTLQQELKRLKRLCPIVQEIIIHIKDNKYIYSSETTYTEETLRSVRGLNLIQLKTEGNKGNLKIVEIKASEKVKKEKGVIVSYPFNVVGNKNIGSITLIVDDRELRKTVESMIPNEHKEFLILYKNRLIWELNEVKEQDLFKIQVIVSSVMASEEEIKLGNKTYQMFYHASPTTQLQYVLALDQGSEMAQIHYIKWGFFVMTLLAMGISSGVIYILMAHTYKPLRNINNLLNEMTLEGMEEKNEFEKIQEAITRLTSENKQLDNRLEKMVDSQESYLYYKLLKGIYDQEVEKIVEQLGKTYKGYYRVVIYKMYGNGDNSKKEHLVHILRTVCPSDIVHIELGMEMQQVSCIFNSSEQSIGELRANLESIRQFYMQLEGDILVGIGQAYYDWRKIAQSFQDAKLALDYKKIANRNEMIWWEKVEKKEKLNHLSGRILVKLKVDIGKRDKVAVKEGIESLKEDIRQKESNCKEARMLCKQLINEILTSLESKERDYLVKSEMLPVEEEIIRIDSLDKFDFVMDKIIYALGDMLEWSQQTLENLAEDKSSLYIQIMKDMKDNYGKSDLSIQEIADKNNIALPNLTTYFKKQVGQTPKDYLTHIRMKRAKELLITTGDSLNDIANQVGYQNTSSFIRQFKKVEGITPGEYRKMK